MYNFDDGEHDATNAKAAATDEVKCLRELVVLFVPDPKLEHLNGQLVWEMQHHGGVRMRHCIFHLLHLNFESE